MNAPLRFPRCGTRRGAFQPWADDAIRSPFRAAPSQYVTTRRYRESDPYPRDRSDKDPAPREPQLASIIRSLEICVLRAIRGSLPCRPRRQPKPSGGPRHGPRITRIQRIKTSERMNAPLRFPRCGTRRGTFQPWADDAASRDVSRESQHSAAPTPSCIGSVPQGSKRQGSRAAGSAARFDHPLP
jgi:hypothetical protein